MIRFAEVFPEKRIVSALLRELSWSLRLEQHAADQARAELTAIRKKRDTS